MSEFQILTVPCLTDNFAFLIAHQGQAVAVDPSEAAPILKVLEEKKWKLVEIWNTHHHWDHVGGNRELKQKTGCRIRGSHVDRFRIPDIDEALTDGASFHLWETPVEILAVPGHTIGAIAYYLPQPRALFTGDTLFVMGCGRLFEGTATQMFESLKKLSGLPDDTQIYCGHEYARANFAFAHHVFPEDERIQARAKKVEAQLNNTLPSVPALMAEERLTNPFLRAPDAEAFAEIRRQKDNFR